MYTLDNNTSVKLLQLTDTHLSATEDGHLLGMKTFHSLQCVIDLVQQGHPSMDLVLVTGDLSQDGSRQSYELLASQLDRFDAPSFWLPGNHDDTTQMDLVHTAKRKTDRVIRSEFWQIVLLDSQVSGKVYGELAQDQLELLQQALVSAPNLHTLVSFHHHPVDMGSRWIDNIGIRNSDELMAIVRAHPSVKCLLWGHVHQSSDQTIDGVRYLSSPSTCVQFEPDTEDFSVDRKGPGYRWLELHADGTVTTSVKRVEHVEFEVDYSVKGY